jgi:arsenate reductase
MATEARPSDAPARRVLFLCIHNSARSQIAEGLARARAPRGVEVWSAGTEPSRVHPWAVKVMEEIGIDIRSQTSKRLDQVPWRDADTVVTLCGEADEACPAVGGDVRRLHWPLPDPSAAREADQPRVFRQVRDEIDRRLEALWIREPRTL